MMWLVPLALVVASRPGKSVGWPPVRTVVRPFGEPIDLVLNINSSIPSTKE